MYVLHIKKIIRNPAIIIPIIFMFALSIYYLFFYSGGYESYLQGALCKLLLAVPYVFFCFLFISYEIFHSYCKNEVHESLCTNRISIKYQRYDFYILFVLDSMITLLFIAYQIRFYYGMGYSMKPLIWYSLKVAIIFWGLVILLGIIIGWGLSGIQNKLVGMSLLLAVFYLFDRPFLQLLMGISQGRLPACNFATLFCIFTSAEPGAITDTYYLMSAEHVHLFRILFWIFLMLFLLFQVAKNKAAVLWGIAAIVCLILFFQPTGASYSLPVINRFDRWHAEQFYYDNAYTGDSIVSTKTDMEDFNITAYDIDFWVDDILNAKALLKISDRNLDQYCFTLYHCYHVTNVVDQKGEKLRYRQKGDYLTVYPSNEELSEVTIEYKGASQYFYSTGQGIMLPANFEYYPIAGKRTTFVYNNYNTCFSREVAGHNAEFDVTVYYKGDLKVYSNLSEKEAARKGKYRYIRYKSTSDGMTIVGSPYLLEKEIDQVRVVYSQLEHDNNPTRKDNMEELRDFFETLEELGHPLYNKTFIIAPENNLQNYCFSENHIFNQIFGAKEQAIQYYKYGKLYDEPDEEDRDLMDQAEDMFQ